MSFDRSSISVVITCFSEGELIFEAVNSVRNQSMQPLEIIIVNDASKDQATNKVCQQLEQQSNIKIIWRSQNGGPSAARNDGFNAAIGEILVPLDADDLLPKKALQDIQSTFEKYPKTDFLYGDYVKQRSPNDDQVINPGDIALSRMLKSSRFSPTSQWTLIGTAPLRKRLWENLGECDPLLGAEDLHDLEFWIRAIASGCEYRYIPEVIYIWRKYLGRNSRKVNPLSWYRIAEKHFDVYTNVGLRYRAYELMLLGSKWSSQPEQSKIYTQNLMYCILKGQFRFSSLIALFIPTALLKMIVTHAAQRR